ncbi:hydantoinase B/oxoprolinase family protein [Novosphingobium sp.]|uniref:hydantoinase B/oxoprolinase family protein n=1 Tax=Novosphingobium sp. TaxID=1874826 RepID=UPI0028A897C2|nr:hydantoinase B/oxoprolinase family protein [Novosphingobium sp.]
MGSGWQFWIDRGGTFTDIVGRRPDGTFVSTKLLSENPQRYRDAATAGIRTLLDLPLDAPLPDGLVSGVKMGTTVATNALLERQGAPLLLVVNEGFGDLLEIGDQSRPDLFALDIRLPQQLYTAVEEVGGRCDVDGATISPLDETAAARMFARHREQGITACAIALVHGWKYPEVERRLADLARKAGFTQVSTSHGTSALLGLVSRASTTVVDAYLSPVLRDYVGRVVDRLGDVPLYFMQSSGGLTDHHTFQGKDAILSGPAGGVIGAARTAQAAGFERIIGFDMGGTSTDVALYAGALERVIDAEVAGAKVRVPMIAINTVAAGGGSILHFDGARYRVGPDSAGADPGPACYRRGGPLTVTDANVMLGRIAPAFFPAIFGPDGDLPLDGDVVAQGFATLAGQVERATGRPTDPREVAESFVRVAVAAMARAIKEVSTERGHDAADFTLQCFGGAGGQHACMVAAELGISTVFIHPFAGVLSAYGMGLADRSEVRRVAVERPLDAGTVTGLRADAATIAAELAETIATDKESTALRNEARVHLRYQGTDTSIAVALDHPGAMTDAFDAAHVARFGFSSPGRALVVDSIEVEVILPGEAVSMPPLGRRAPGEEKPVLTQMPLWAEGRENLATVYDRAELLAGDRIDGPALIREPLATTVVEPGWAATVDDWGNLVLRQERASATPASREHGEGGHAESGHAVADPMMLELFNNMFMAVAEQMGAVLRHTSTSVNIKERLDFSCALFDAEGNLIANAPHVPVHLGAMGESVRAVLAAREGSLKPGDMVALNDPYRGGTHLPDVTVVAPVFDEAGERIRFFVANRGHHADIGGIAPGSTPAVSTSLEQEGVVIDDFLLREGGTFREQPLRDLLAAARYPARNPDMNVADLKAQVAANETGISEIMALLRRYGWNTVSTYVGHMMANAEESLRRVIDRIGDGAFDYRMDDGARLRVQVSVDRARRSATIDFTGTDAQRDGNFNAPPAVTQASVLYAFRCLVDSDLPLNEGCLVPLEIVVPEGTFLSPRPGAAVVAGNTEVSQAVCNALLGALGATASAQATMNNFLFGNDRVQYYETICGGAGASARADGASAVHTHMTNTRITDPEVLEMRYPVRLECFAIRKGSGGEGRHRGGNGVVRKVMALEPLTATIVSSRRSEGPFGLQGGAAGEVGRQWVERSDGSRTDLGGTAEVPLAIGDAIVIETPGGGGFGAPSDVETTA